ncbi:NgoPII family restriction endonuclease [Macrococcoides caseolyticum]|uniref:NgoPII family restriction endonuclease n=1 Tax=Macrococcoides caseolyticum TaxID=69966 RepID=UPI0012FF4C64|nr:NgoPII family restriction endonuclease [Macrococcus caseolyticus]
MNIIEPIINLITNQFIIKKTYFNKRNSPNFIRENLEEYVKNLFTGTTNEIDKKKAKM